MKEKLLLWDNDGTIMGSLNPNDKTVTAKVILPGVKEVMEIAKFNCIISGFKSPESEMQDFDPAGIIAKFTDLMHKLPISIAAFSPMVGGVACYVVINKRGVISVQKAHEMARYKEYVGKFKKPDIGMFCVMKDIVQEEFAHVIDKESAIMIGDTWHDEAAAQSFGVPFVDAKYIHGHSK